MCIPCRVIPPRARDCDCEGDESNVSDSAAHSQLQAKSASRGAQRTANSLQHRPRVPLVSRCAFSGRSTNLQPIHFAGLSPCGMETGHQAAGDARGFSPAEASVPNATRANTCVRPTRLHPRQGTLYGVNEA